LRYSVKILTTVYFCSTTFIESSKIGGTGNTMFSKSEPTWCFRTRHWESYVSGSQSNNCDKILLATFCSVGARKSSTFVSNFPCWLQVVFDTGVAHQVTLPGC